jgi:peptidoglycan/xylan/chitin deacetylase (PgdA/CDA1 family)
MPSVGFKVMFVCVALWQTTVVRAMAKSMPHTMDNAVILMYHHVSESTPAVTSVSPQRFKQHMLYLTQQHQVLPLETIVSTLKKGESLPDKAVGITFDDGYNNIFENAHPILYKLHLPYTVFINPALIGTQAYQLTWQQVKLMAQQGATFANHGNVHQHMLARQAHESHGAWLTRIMADIDEAEKELKQHLGYSLRYLAYPYGEFDRPLKTRINKEGYTGFGQHSGAVASYSDFGALPRYPAAGIYANLESLKVKLDSLAMPVKDISPDDPKRPFNTKNLALSFTINDQDLNLQQVACFQNSQKLAIIRRQTGVRVNIPQPFPVGRSRVNCTAPSMQYTGRFYWFSQPWFVADKEGHWLD